VTQGAVSVWSMRKNCEPELSVIRSVMDVLEPAARLPMQCKY
jgi:hypothetical protein